jgi:CheY-like chemotaxis protein
VSRKAIRSADARVGRPTVSSAMLKTRGGHESPVGYSAPQGRVLIADDVPEVVQLLRDFLTEQGYEVHTATTGIEVLNAVVPFQPDVILLDMQMPRLSGMNVLDELRRAGLTVPVILISARRRMPGRDFSRRSRSHSRWTP